MTLLQPLLLGAALSMDSCAVAIALGVAWPRMSIAQMARIAVCFGAFQGAMPVAGWWLGRAMSGWFGSFDHWIAFGLLSALGGRMIWEGLRAEPSVPARAAPHALALLLLLGFGTSIDALAVGFSLSLVDEPVAASAICAGAITAASSAAGAWLGAQLGRRFQRAALLTGGLVLIGIGVQVLLEHLRA